MCVACESLMRCVPGGSTLPCNVLDMMQVELGSCLRERLVKKHPWSWTSSLEDGGFKCNTNHTLFVYHLPAATLVNLGLVVSASR